jgi:hypothetical protein
VELLNKKKKRGNEITKLITIKVESTIFGAQGRPIF